MQNANDPGVVMADVFSAHAGLYDRSRRQLIPSFEAFYGTAPRILEALDHHPRRCLDLGAGTGLMSAVIAGAHPIEDLMLLDRSAEMLEQSRDRLAAVASVATVVAPMQAIDVAALGLGSFDTVWSALAIHHLDGGEKRALFGTVHDLLRPGGLFINADQSLGPNAAIERAYRAQWLSDVRALGVADHDVAMALERMREDRMDTLADQLDWLREAGFEAVHCWFQDFSFNVYAASKVG